MVGLLRLSLKITAKVKKKSPNNHHLSQQWEQNSKWRMTSKVTKKSPRKMASTQSRERLLEVVPSASAFINNLSQLRLTTIRGAHTESKIYR
jgi:hypothetical protein